MRENGDPSDVRQWDSVAGESVDWAKCHELVEKALAEYGCEERVSKRRINQKIEWNQSKSIQDCECFVATWENAFGNFANIMSAETCPTIDVASSLQKDSHKILSRSTKLPLYSQEFIKKKPVSVAKVKYPKLFQERQIEISAPSKSIGAVCAKCGITSLVLHRVPSMVGSNVSGPVCQRCLKILRKRVI